MNAETNRITVSGNPRLKAIAPNYVHMHVNRMLRSAHGNQEFVLYDFLARIYESRAIRARPREQVVPDSK